jgi:hypothetical protein
MVLKKYINLILILLMIVIFYYRDGSTREIKGVKELFISYPESTVVTDNAVIKILMDNIYKWEIK